MRTKFIFVTGGVLSSLGKGLASASLGALLEARGLSITLVKMDPYINVDPGTMNPLQHGEVFVTDDGAETDLDLGHYERYTRARLSVRNNFSLDWSPRSEGYTVFAEVIEGMSTVDAIAIEPTGTVDGRPDVPLQPIKILEVVYVDKP